MLRSFLFIYLFLSIRRNKETNKEKRDEERKKENPHLRLQRRHNNLENSLNSFGPSRSGADGQLCTY